MSSLDTKLSRTYIISVQPVAKAHLLKASFIIAITFGTPAILGESEVIMSSSHETAGKVIMYLEHGA